MRNGTSWRAAAGALMIVLQATLARADSGPVVAPPSPTVDLTVAVLDVHTIVTIRDVAEFVGIVDIGVTFGSDILSGWDESRLNSMAHYLDYAVVGAGESIRLDPNQVIALILAHRAEHGDKGLEDAVISYCSHARRTPSDFAKKAAFSQAVNVSIGGFFVTEFEHHQEPDGKFKSLLEINQLRIYFMADANSASTNHVRFLAEWNPVPEEVVHQIDDVTVVENGISHSIVAPGPPIVEGLIPFERLAVTVENVAGSHVDFTAGQIQNPFGLWSDYTSHRNFSSAKNNMLVNGFALKKIELGVVVQSSIASHLFWKAAVVHGRQTRTAPLDRGDADDRKDGVGRIWTAFEHVEIGASAYLGDFSNQNIAAGADWRITFGRLLASGELVYQRNENPSRTFGVDLDRLEAQSAYAQFSWSLPWSLRIYGFYELFRYLADGDQVHDVASKIYHGVSYQFRPNLRWTIAEVGFNEHNDFDKGRLHASTQLEFSF